VTDNDPNKPDRWADLLDPRYDYPEDVSGLSRRQRRRAKRNHRRDDRGARKQWILDQRQRSAEPATAARGIGALVLVLLIVGGFSLVTWLRDDEPAEVAPVASTAPSTQPASPTSPTPTETAAATNDGMNAEEVLLAWAGEFYNREPESETDEFTEFLSESTPWMTRALFENLRDAGDSTYLYLAQNGGTVTLVDSSVTMPPEGTAPVDTEYRATRVLTITTRMEVEGQEPQEIVTPLMVELANDDGWLVASIAGGVE
jgi:hypothetical protein